MKFLFGKHGEVTDCKLLKDKTGKSRRCAYVGYSKESDAAKALKKLNGTTLGISKERFYTNHSLADTNDRSRTLGMIKGVSNTVNRYR